MTSRHGSKAASHEQHANGTPLWWFTFVLTFFAISSVAAPLTFRDQAGHRVADLNVAHTGRVGFTLMPPEKIGITFSNVVPESRSLTNHILLNGSGVAAGDVDGDGWCDLFFCGIGGGSKLYRNLGNWRFQEITASAGLDLKSLDATGALLADVDGDGDLDLLVSCIRGGVRLFLNDGSGHFQDVTSASGLASTTAGMSLAMADIDGKGSLALYLANYRNETLRDSFSMQVRVANAGGRRVITMLNGRPLKGDLAGWVSLDANGAIIENGQADVLYRNDGHGKFVAASFTDGTFLDETGQPLKTPLYDWTLTAMFRDLNGDGLPDLYVCSDLASPDRIWLNKGDGHFQMIRPTAIRKTSWFSMGVDVGDLNRDGFDDIFVTDMLSTDHRLRQVQVSNHQLFYSLTGVIDNRPQVPRNTLFLNRGDGDYSEIAYFSGIYASDWSWSPIFLDVDLDGYEDVLLSTGFERDVQDVDIANELETARRTQKLSDAEALRLRSKFPQLKLPKHAFHNRGDMTFEETGSAWGFDTQGVSHGTALADLDNDGDLDVIVNNMNGVAGIYRNDGDAPRVAVRLKGQPPNTRGIGARLRVRGGAVPLQTQEMQSGGRYLSSDDPMRVFAAGTMTNVLGIEVLWRSGKRSVVESVRPNQLVEMVEPPGNTEKQPINHSQPSPLFQDVSSLLSHTHHEEDFDDFSRQPLLPHKLSQLGPGVCWADLDGDGWDDLLIASGKGGSLAAFRNDGKGAFGPFTQKPFGQAVSRDQTTVLAAQLTPVGSWVIAGSSNYEDARSEGSAVVGYDMATGQTRDLIPATKSSTGPLALGDYDGDGQLDLFVGGRVIAGRYPEPASSRLFRNTDGKFAEDSAAEVLLRGVGLVSGATWADLDSDGFPELILVSEWGPIRIFRNDHGRLTEWNPALTLFSDKLKSSIQSKELRLNQLTGWWNGIAVGDFDGDGHLDFIASNWGENTKYQSYRQKPLTLFYGDFNDSGGVEMLEAYYDPSMQKTVPWQHFGRIGAALPFVTASFKNFRQFGEASVEEILGKKKSAGKVLEVNWLETTVFLNRQDHFEAHPLPMEAQLSPAFGICVADIDNDGNEDVFLGQNFFATEPETDRYDAGRGLWLRGDGKGNFSAMSGAESGVRVYGEQRGAAVADFDHDGRVDFCVSQNGAATRLFKNIGGRPGIRIRLQGPSANPTGVGAQVRCSHCKAIKEVHAGSGYWSQDSAVLIFPPIVQPAEITVRWPGGKITNTRITPGEREFVIKYPESKPK